MSLCLVRVALDYSMLKRMNMPVALTPEAPLVFRGPKNKLLDVMRGEEDHVATQEAPDPVLVPGQYVSKRQEFAYMPQYRLAGLPPALRRLRSAYE